MRSKFILIGVAGFGAGLLIAIFLARVPAEPFNAERLRSALTQWRDAGIKSYTIRYRMSGSEYQVEVVQGVAVSATVNGVKLLAPDLSPYSVDGIFSTLQQELDNLADKSGPFGEQARGMIARARFQPQFGYPELYLRSGLGAIKAASIEVIEFQPSAD